MHSCKLKGIAICGTLPPGVPPNFYVEIAKNKPQGVILLLDALNEKCLETGQVDILKINGDEANALMTSQNGCFHSNSQSIEGLGLRIIKEFPVRIVAITNGASWFSIINFSSYLFENINNQYSVNQISIPNIESFCNASNTDVIINPLGAGDTCAGVFLSEYLVSKDTLKSFKLVNFFLFILGAFGSQCLLFIS